MPDTMPDAGVLEPWIRTLAGHWRGRQAWILTQQTTLAGIAAPTGGEARRAAWLAARLGELPGLPVRIDRHGNVCATIDAPAAPISAAPIVCLAHLDTVFDAETPLTVRRDGSVIHCPGIGDNGRGLAALLTLAHGLHAPDTRQRLRRPVHLVATVGEEGAGNLRGARGWFDDQTAAGCVPLAAIAVDGPGDDVIVHRAPGAIRLGFTMTGRGGHSWIDADIANPLHAIGDLIAAIARLGAAQEQGTTIAATRVSGGESLTAIPAEARVDVDIRSLSSARLEHLRRELVRLAHQCVADETTRHPRASLSLAITVLGERPAGGIDEDSTLVRTAIDATRCVGRTPRAAVASTDANIPLARGIPAIAIGAGGSGGGAHTTAEWYDDQDGHIGIERLLRLVLTLAAA